MGQVLHALKVPLDTSLQPSVSQSSEQNGMTRALPRVSAQPYLEYPTSLSGSNPPNKVQGLGCSWLDNYSLPKRSPYIQQNPCSLLRESTSFFTCASPRKKLKDTPYWSLQSTLKHTFYRGLLSSCSMVHVHRIIGTSNTNI